MNKNRNKTKLIALFSIMGALLLGAGVTLAPRDAMKTEAADTATISFASTTLRASLTTTQQVWKDTDSLITMTVVKNTGSNIADYTNPIRIYQHHGVTFTWDASKVASIESVVITGNTVAYTTATINSTLTNGSTSGSGTTATLTATTPSSAMTLTAGAQVRWNSLVVNYTKKASGSVVTALTVSPTSKSLLTTSTLVASDYTVSVTKDGNPGTSADYTAKIGTGTGAGFSGTDIVWGTAPKVADKTIQFRAKYPTTSGGSTYRTADVALTVTEPVFGTLTSISIKTPATKLTFQVGETFSRPGLVITASDDSTPVVTKDLTSGFTTNREGLVFTAGHLGPQTVTVSYTEGVTKTVNYSITVVPVPVFASFTKITSIADLHVGSHYVIGGIKDSNTWVMTTTQNGNNRAAEQATMNGAMIKETASTQVLELVEGNKTGSYGFKVLDGGDYDEFYLAAASSSSNYLRSQENMNDNSSWNITFSSGTLTLVAQGTYSRNVMQFNATNNPPIFAAYAAASQVAVSLYIDEDTIPTSGFGTLDHITVNTTNAKTSYYAGETFSTVGLVVTAFDNKPEPESKIVADFTTSILEDTVLSTLGEHNVTVTYVEGVSKSTTYKINVLRAQTYTKLATADEIRFGQMYALGSADGAASTSVGTFTGEVAVNYNEDNDSFTTVTNLQLVALKIGAVKGSYAIQLLNGPSVDKYYSWTTGNEIRVSSEINEASSWFIAFDGEVLKITHAVDPTRFIGHNHTSTRFAAYTGTTTPAASLYMDFATYEVEGEVMILVDAVNTGIGNNAQGNCHVVYEFLNDVYSRLSVAGKAFFDTDEDYADIIAARNRMAYLAAWTAANPESGDSALNNVYSSNSIYIIVIISILGISTLAGYYFIRKRPKEEIN